MRSLQVHAALRDRVRSVQVIESTGGEQRVLPSVGAVLGFQYRGRVRAGDQLLSLAGVTGMQSGPRCYRYEPGTATILVRFAPQGAACLGVSAASLTGQSVALDAILPAPLVREASERLFEASDLAARIEVVQKLLLSLPFTSDRLVARAIERLTAEQEPKSVAEVARELGISERQLERRFRERVGVSPKRMASLQRFERALSRLPAARSLAQLAVDAGYYDQSHLIRDFRSHSGQAPGRLLAALR